MQAGPLANECHTAFPYCVFDRWRRFVLIDLKFIVSGPVRCSLIVEKTALVCGYTHGALFAVDGGAGSKRYWVFSGVVQNS